MESAKQLVEIIKEGIEEKKGEKIAIVDLTGIDGAITNYFVICQGNSSNQVEAIAESIGDKCRDEAGEKPISVNGLGYDQWVALDYVDVIVHIFQPEARAFYDLENLWNDAKITRIADAQPSATA